MIASHMEKEHLSFVRMKQTIFQSSYSICIPEAIIKSCFHTTPLPAICAASDLNFNHSNRCTNSKECSNYRTTVLISHASKVMLKIFQARLQQYINHELPDVQVGFRKDRGTRVQTANIHWIIKKAREFQKKHIFLLY